MNVPNIVVGYKSPYPTVVIVTTAHQKPVGMLINLSLSVDSA